MFLFTTSSMIGDSIINILYKILLSLDSIIYSLISWLYQVFNILASCQLFKSEFYTSLSQRIYVIIGVITLFILSYQLLLLVINPDENKIFGEGKKIIVNVITSLAMIVLVPVAFDVLFSFQNSILKNDTIGEIILTDVNDDSANFCANAENSIDCYGNKMAVDTFQAFFYPASATISDIENNSAGNDITAEYNDEEITLNEAYEKVTTEGKFMVFTAFSDNIVDKEISYIWLISTIMGGIMAYIILVYCLDLGLRAVKLAFYEIIAPLPIIVRVIPSLSKVFSSWIKATLSTYAEVFIRIAVLYFAIFAFSYVPSIMNGLFQGLDQTSDPIIYLLVRVILILGIIIFIRKFPELISEITGIKSGNFSANFMDRIKEAAFIPAAIGGTIAGHGNPLAGIRAARAAWKNKDLRGIGAEVKRRAEIKQLKDEGASRFEIFKAMQKNKWRNALGLDSEYDAEISKIDKEMESVENKNGFNITFKDEKGNDITIAPNQSINIGAAEIERLEAQKIENVEKMSTAKDEIKTLQDSIDYGKRIASIAGNVKEEAEKKIDEKGSKEQYTLNYKQTRRITGENGEEQEVEIPFFTGTYEQIVERINKMTDKERADVECDLSEIRKQMINNYIARESKEDGLIKFELESGFETIQRKGFTCRVKNENGEIKSVEYKIEKENDNYYAYYLDDNNEKVYIMDDSGQNKATDYELADKLKGMAKSSNNILGLEIQEIQQEKVDPLEAQNSGIDALIRQSKDKKEAKKNTSKMIKKKKIVGYVASNKPPEDKKK